MPCMSTARTKRSPNERLAHTPPVQPYTAPLARHGDTARYIPRQPGRLGRTTAAAHMTSILPSFRPFGLARLTIVSALVAPVIAQDPPALEPEPERDWFFFEGATQTRYESLDNRLRRPETGSNQGLFHRTTLHLGVRDEFTQGGLEIIDSRIFGEPDDARTTTGQVNTLDLLQLYYKATFEDTVSKGDSLEVLLGRHTMDIGSRRFVARNRYRSTINAFTGANLHWKGTDGSAVRSFFVLPTQRLPGNGEIDELRDNEQEFDEERSSLRFMGIHGSTPEAATDSTLEGFIYRLLEGDAQDLNTRDRALTTIGFRWWNKPEPGAFPLGD